MQTLINPQWGSESIASDLSFDMDLKPEVGAEAEAGTGSGSSALVVSASPARTRTADVVIAGEASRRYRYSYDVDDGIEISDENNDNFFQFVIELRNIIRVKAENQRPRPPYPVSHF